MNNKINDDLGKKNIINGQRRKKINSGNTKG